ncbi:site-specific integrase [Colwellia sp. 6_MG-2023]|uniref:tyrosine-type recombinase/integrase n=1 Tax=Colwellia sp. 6_MG-2023 TaxID=3062676 RepID=UPI0026E12791|nr:site-specific integrase [Colwellia sp. 6_MG-2023]MDO6488419.1 site-specific integrase [Colwellia sp. 6_MG-2023]
MIKSQTETYNDIYEDFQLLSIKVDTLANIKISECVDNDTGEITLKPHLSPSNRQKYRRKTDIIIAPDGSVVYPQSLYLVSKLRGEAAVKDTKSIAKALLMFTRYLDSTHYSQFDENNNEIPPEYLTYKTLSKYEEEGAPWRFAEYLLANCRHANSNGDESLALSTARTYMGAVIGFYKWMQKYGYIKNDETHLMTHFTEVERFIGVDQHDMLAHTKSGMKREYEISNIMKMFPKAESTPPHKKLKPMTFDHRELFEKYVEQLPKPFPLMFKLIVSSGLRIEEVTHFPAHDIGKSDYSGLDVVPTPIIVTKGGKPRTVEIPVELYEELEQYKESKQREINLIKRNKLIESGEERDSTNYLFISNKGKQYTENTLEKHFSALRTLIQEVDASWYYRVHDGRSTFATHWLWKEHQSRGVDYNFLMDELAELMGHSNTGITQKYVIFMDKRDHQLSIAKSKNNKINGGW